MRFRADCLSEYNDCIQVEHESVSSQPEASFSHHSGGGAGCVEKVSPSWV